MRKRLPNKWLVFSGGERYTCDLCGRSVDGVEAIYCPVWEDYGFKRVNVGIMRRQYLLCMTHRDKEIQAWEETIR